MRRGAHGRCDRVTTGHVSAGLQTGYCADTGGGWGKMFVAHRSQLHPVPDELSEQRAVLIEPLSCAVHTALRADVEPNADVVVIGAGTIGVLTLLALKELTKAGTIAVVAKHGRQREWAGAFGATEIVDPKEATNAIRRNTRAIKLKPERGASFLLGGADVVIDCVGSVEPQPRAPDHPRRRPRRRLRHPDRGADLTRCGSASSSSWAPTPAGTRPSARARARNASTRSRSRPTSPCRTRSTASSGATYPLRRWREAIDHALGAGKLGTLKVAFDPRMD